MSNESNKQTRGISALRINNDTNGLVDQSLAKGRLDPKINKFHFSLAVDPDSVQDTETTLKFKAASGAYKGCWITVHKK